MASNEKTAMNKTCQVYLKTALHRNLTAKKSDWVTKLSEMEYSMKWVRNDQPVGIFIPWFGVSQYTVRFEWKTKCFGMFFPQDYCHDWVGWLFKVLSPEAPPEVKVSLSVIQVLSQFLFCFFLRFIYFKERMCRAGGRGRERGES